MRRLATFAVFAFMTGCTGYMTEDLGEEDEDLGAWQTVDEPVDVCDGQDLEIFLQNCDEGSSNVDGPDRG